ncbi:amino acid/amide ABC transporter membrane protein 2, HAAT family (TC 3.A.1.4.-) [Collimonas sp. OK242]|nr:amino acid/amide ABC transporter membrane protein 2, HAAT family (TC 3.A.1.4.-) [Collimonas sp. OK242]
MDRRMNMSMKAERSWIWMAFALILLAAPWVFPQSAALSILSQCGSMMILALSFNMLLGQTGMLSFGHALYSGLAAFVAVHVMNRLAGGSPVALLLVPLAGGCAGMLCGVVFGFITTRKSGTALSMISLALVELAAAAALMFPGWFGGESGVSTDRVLGAPFLGIDFASQLQVYYLIAFWLFVSTAAMYGLTLTPLGRIANAVRDNPERAAFIGHDPRRVRYLMFILSAFFAGVGGALSAINFEIVSAENLSLLRSAQILLFTFIGGIGYFFGPMIGALLGVLFSALLSTYTRGWQLYLGLLFVIVVLFAPGGIAGVWMTAVTRWRRLSALRLRQLALPSLLRLAGLLLLAGGAVLLIETLYRRAAGI